MNLASSAYLILLAAFAAAWIVINGEQLGSQLKGNPGLYIAAVAFLYLLSHLFRMMRLAVLTLDQRDKILPLTTTHAVTAFPSSLIPFKLGEVLRLASFLMIYQKRRKALAIWLVERFCDLIVMCSLILILYIADVEVSATLKFLFIFFFVAGSLAILVFFSVAKIFIFINQYLVLSSHSQRGLRILKISHSLRLLELAIIQSVQGRLPGLIALSAAIWMTEVLVIFLVLGEGTFLITHLSAYFVTALSSILLGASVEFSELYFLCQTAVLIVLASVFGVFLAIGFFTRHTRGYR